MILPKPQLSKAFLVGNFLQNKFLYVSIGIILIFIMASILQLTGIVGYVKILTGTISVAWLICLTIFIISIVVISAIIRSYKI